MKRIAAAFLTLALVLLPAITSFNASNAEVYLNGEMSSCKARLYGGYAYIPLRDFCRERGLDVGWDKKTRSAVIMGDGFIVVYKDKSCIMNIFEQKLNIKSPCFIENGTFFVPARSLGTIFKTEVSWDDEHRAVCFGKAPSFENTKEGENDELYCLSRIISAESAGEPMEGKIAVGNVVLNRVKSPDFPNTVYDVIFDRNYGTQFTPVALGTVYCEPTNESVEAARRCLEGESSADNCLYFFNPEISTAQGWIVNNRVFCKSLGHHDFYF